MADCLELLPVVMVPHSQKPVLVVVVLRVKDNQKVLVEVVIRRMDSQKVVVVLMVEREDGMDSDKSGNPDTRLEPHLPPHNQGWRWRDKLL